MSYTNAPRLDASNIAGITTLMNPQHLKNNINLQQVENTIMKKEKLTKIKDDFDPIKQYTNEISQLAEELGVNLVIPFDNNIKQIKENKPITIIKEPKQINTIDLNDSDNKSNSSKSSKTSKTSSKSSSSSSNNSRSNRSRSSKSSKIVSNVIDDIQSTIGDKNIDVDRFLSNLDKDIGINISEEKYKKRYNIPKLRNNSIKDEYKPNSIIDNVVSEMHNENNTSYGSEREKVRDIKVSKIEQISQLRMTLEEEGINCNNIAQPTLDTSLEQIDSILNILRLKNDRNRYSTLAEEIILGFAEGIETIFDGSRTVPIINWQPDYRGYHSTVNIKLHRMRFETSQVVGNVIEKYEISPTMRIIMELLPSFFLYPRQQSKQKNTPGLHSDPKINDASLAFASIAEMDGRKKTEELSKI